MGFHLTYILFIIPWSVYLNIASYYFFRGKTNYLSKIDLYKILLILYLC
uniref:Uncharacterized protein n=1 Tax=Haliotis diversicolor TaxID=36095 RepID=B3TK82_HALDV|nr:unknown protein 30 [Haliotis diversicolor]